MTEEDFWMQHQDLIENQQIYITSDEKIKEGDWFLSKTGIVHNTWGWNYGDKKIILTTDQSLNGVQAINDEFLEWFEKNPSCEEVEVFHQDVYSMGKWDRRYKIIIPKEEETKCYCGHTTTCDCGSEEPKQDKIMERFIANAKQETLEEVAKQYAKQYALSTRHISHIGFEDGAKWQAERMYSEADNIMKFLDAEVELKLSYKKTIERIKWYFKTYFEQFKKK